MDFDICSRMANNGTDSIIDDDWSIWKMLCALAAIHEFIATKHIDPRRSPPWITPNICNLICEGYHS